MAYSRVQDEPCKVDAYSGEQGFSECKHARRHYVNIRPIPLILVDPRIQMRSKILQSSFYLAQVRRYP